MVRAFSNESLIRDGRRSSGKKTLQGESPKRDSDSIRTESAMIDVLRWNKTACGASGNIRVSSSGIACHRIITKKSRS